MASCCGDVLVTSPPPPPPPVGPDCLRVAYVCQCIAGIDTWVQVLYECIPNAQCTGQLSCTDLQCVIEQFNGCVIGDPLPPPLAPFCAPHCCADDTTTTTSTTTTPPVSTTTTTTITPPPTTTTTTTLPPTTTTTTPPPTTTTTAPPPLFCNCLYGSVWGGDPACSTSAWSTPELQGCVEENFDNTDPWAYLSGCVAETIVSASGACDTTTTTTTPPS
jgi:hypothetical protein